MGRELSEALILEEILHQAEQLEKNYDWLGARAGCVRGVIVRAIFDLVY
jgi:hypothetical protein